MTTRRRVATFATGTPIADSLGELWVMQRYLRPDLAAAGVAELGTAGSGVHRNPQHSRGQRDGANCGW